MAWNLGNPTMVQAGFLRATIRTALNSHGKAAICLDNCLAKGDQFLWAAVIGNAGKRSVGNVIECCGSSVEYCTERGCGLCDTYRWYS